MEHQNEKLSINIKSFRTENSKLKNIIHKVDKTRHDPRSWLKGMQSHVTKQMNEKMFILSEKLNSETLLQYANDSEILKLSKFVEWSKRFISFINCYTKILSEDDSKFLDKWEKNNSKEK